MSRITRREALKQGAKLAVVPALAASANALAVDDDPYADAVLVDGAPPLPMRDAFTIVVLPDTQNYCHRFPEQFVAQTEWIAANREKRNIACVLHLGDVTHLNSKPEWKNAVKALSVLDGKTPYFLTTGNHDYSKMGSCRDRETLLNDYFPASKFRESSLFGGVYDKEPDRIENAYYRVLAGGSELLILMLEFAPRNDVIRWANEVVRKHQELPAILVTHAYMYHDDTRYDWAKYGRNQLWSPYTCPIAENSGGDLNDGEQLWDKLVSRHENFLFVVSGHVLADGLGRLVTPTPSGRDVPQMLVNFQMRPNGGDGWLRLIEIQPDLRSARIYDYSPSRNQRNKSPQNQFDLPLAPPYV